MTDPIPTRRSLRPTPAWLIFGLLVVEGLLWLSERLPATRHRHQRLPETKGGGDGAG